jgi:adenine nucleotide transporter 17
MVAMVLTYPLGTVSTRTQVASKAAAGGKAAAAAPGGQLETLRKILRDEGVGGLYSGINSALFGIAITQVL